MINSSSFEPEYKYVPFLTMLSVAFALAYPILTNRLIITPLGIMPATVIVISLWFVLGNIIAEVYGYKLAMKIFWSVLVCQLIAAVICHYLIRLNSPPSWHGQKAYEFVFGNFLSWTVAEAAALIIAWRVNTYLMTKWKVILEGKYFLIRSFVMASFSEGLFALMMSPTLFWYSMVTDIKVAIHLFLSMNMATIICTFIFNFAAYPFVSFLKKVEELDTFETPQHFNPFKLTRKTVVQSSQNMKDL